jgi:hypothetical protein
MASTPEPDRAERGPEPGAAWRDLLDVLGRAGDALADAARAPDPLAAADGFRYLARLAVFALQWHVELDDPRHPAFYRFGDDLTQWGAPNADNQYLRAAVAADGVYRVTGDVTGVRQLILSTHHGDMALGDHRVLRERNLAELAAGGESSLDVVLARDQPVAGGSVWMPLDEGVDYVLVRVYVADWEHDGVGDLRIERTDTAGTAPAPLTPERLAAALRRAAAWTEHSAGFWDAYSRRVAAGMAPNTLSPPWQVPDGAADIRYGSGTWRLRDGELLLVEFEAPDAQYWSIQAYTLGSFEAIDLRHRQSSLNGEQAHIDADGLVRVVVGTADPGVPNWLDTGGHGEGVLAYRWVWASSFPEPRAAVVPRAELRAHLPSGHPVVTPSERRARLATRQRGAARRFRR